MRKFALLLVAALLMVVSITAVQAQDGFTVECDNGPDIVNGVEVVVVQMRSGFTYTATAVGLDGFDPVLAVLDEDRNGLCNDDANGAARYAANLPTTGRVSASNVSAQITFDQNSSSDFMDVSLVVGGFEGEVGEFILILEGMAVTSGDGAGDPFSVNVTPEMVASGTPLAVYMLTRGQSGVDPFLFLSDGDDGIATDDDGNEIYCDDAGTSLCFGESTALDNYNVTINTGTLPGWQYDAMISLDVSELELSDDRDDNFLTFYMTSYQQSTEGQYLLVFHFGTDEAGNSTASK